MRVMRVLDFVESDWTMVQRRVEIRGSRRGDTKHTALESRTVRRAKEM